MAGDSKASGEGQHRPRACSSYANRQKVITNRKGRNKEAFQGRMEPASKRSRGVKSSQEAFREQRDKQTSLAGRHQSSLILRRSTHNLQGGLTKTLSNQTSGFGCNELQLSLKLVR